MATTRHGGPSGLRIRMRSAEREEESVVLVSQRPAWVLPQGYRGVWDKISAQGGTIPPSAISLIPLSLSPVNRTARAERGKKGRTRATPPPKLGGHVTPDSGVGGTRLYPTPCGSLSSSFIPAGRLGKRPPEAVPGRDRQRRCTKLSPIESLLQYRFATPNPLKARPGPEGCRTAPDCVKSHREAPPAYWR